MKSAFIRYCLALLLLLTLSRCEQDLTIDLPAGKELLVVEGHMEQGHPPLVMLTRSVPVFSDASLAALENSFVHGARITVTSHGKSYPLWEVPSAEFSEELRQAVSLQLGIPIASLRNPEIFQVYVYTTTELTGELGNSYRLEIQHQGQELSAVTTIPQLNPIDSLWYLPHPDPKQDSLKILHYRYVDPDTLGNSIRYFTKRNSEPFYAGLFSSVFNDELVNGKTISFPLDRGEPKNQREVDLEKYSYFGVGDTVTVRWAAIDIPHYRFWYTLENEQNSNGSPIGTPNITQSNIKGGLGIWGGYGVSYHRIIIK
ncbi:DUF4249 family protein [Pontibacter sp. CAU 1760]